MKDISRVAGYIREAEGKVCFIIGAGASKAGGIPLADELIDIVKEKYVHCFDNLSKENAKNYGRVMSAISPTDRKKLFTELLEDSRINWGQIALAAMIKEGDVKRVLTFNFDLILERAAALLGQQYPVYDFAVSPTDMINKIANPSIVHMHGQSFGFVLLNTEDETKKHAAKLKRLISDAVCNHVTIVVGYSGLADAAYDVLHKAYDDENWLIWLGFDKEPPKHLSDLLKNSYVIYIGGCDFDQTMISLADELNVWPPKIFSNPMDHLLDEMSVVTEFPSLSGGDESVDVLTGTRSKLQDYSKKWNKDKKEDWSAKAIEMLVSRKFDSELADILIKNVNELTDEAKNALSWSLVLEGDLLGEEAEPLPDAKAILKYAVANDKYARAISIKPDKYEAYNNWGLSLATEAKLLPDAKAILNYTDANEKYAKVIDIKPDSHEAYNNWGLSLVAEAKSLPDDKAILNYANAYEKYAKAIDIKPDLHETYINWGLSLVAEAKSLPDAKAILNYADANEKYAKAIDIKPDLHEAYNNWGLSLKNEAIFLSNDKAILKYAEAYDKFTKAIKIKPDKHEVYNNWGLTLVVEAKRLTDDKAMLQYALANDKYAKAIEIKPDAHKAYYNWASALSLEAELLEGEAAKEKLLEAEEKALKSKGITEKASYNLACVYALMDRKEEAVEELNACLDDGTLPNLKHLNEDSDMNLLREMDGFKALLKKVEEAENG